MSLYEGNPTVNFTTKGPQCGQHLYVMMSSCIVNCPVFSIIIVCFTCFQGGYHVLAIECTRNNVIACLPTVNHHISPVGNKFMIIFSSGNSRHINDNNSQAIFTPTYYAEYYKLYNHNTTTLPHALNSNKNRFAALSDSYCSRLLFLLRLSTDRLWINRDRSVYGLRGGVTMWHLLSLAEPITRMIPESYTWIQEGLINSTQHTLRNEYNKSMEKRLRGKYNIWAKENMRLAPKR